MIRNSTHSPVRVLRMGIIVMVGASLLPLWYQHSAAWRHWKVQASDQSDGTWYDPITGYHVKEMGGGYTISLKHEFLGDFVAHSALITGKVTKGGKPAAGVEVYFGIDWGPHYGQLAIETKTGQDGTAQVTLPNDGQLGTDLIWLGVSSLDDAGADGPGDYRLTRRRSTAEEIKWGEGPFGSVADPKTGKWCCFSSCFDED
ncbi:MAG: hypothetical protein AB1714_26905 [Acidobacteriota bacterium]